MRGALALTLSLLVASASIAQTPPTAGGMSDITVLSVDIGHFDYGHKIIHVYENSRNQSEYRNSPDKWQFVIEPLLSTRSAGDGSVEYKTFQLNPIFEKIGKRYYPRGKNRVMIPVELINDWAREQALNVALAAYPGIKCKIGRSNVDVLPLTEMTVVISDLESGGLMAKNALIHSKTQSFLTSPKELYLSFDVWESSDSADRVLKRFISFIPYMQINASVFFSVKSTRFNITSITADKIKSTNLYVKLNGQGGVGYVTRLVT